MSVFFEQVRLKIAMVLWVIIIRLSKVDIGFGFKKPFNLDSFRCEYRFSLRLIFNIKVQKLGKALITHTEESNTKHT